MAAPPTPAGRWWWAEGFFAIRCCTRRTNRFGSRRRALLAVPPAQAPALLARLTTVPGPLRHRTKRGGMEAPPLRQRLYAAGPCTSRWAQPAALVELLPEGPAVQQLDATASAVWALGSDGSVYKVEAGSTAQPRRPAAVRLRPPPGLLAVEQLACGTQHVLFLARTQGHGNRAVFCYGDNSEGQCGIGTSLRAVRAPMLVPAVSRQLAVRKLAAGSAHSAAVLSNGGVAVWGGIGSRVGALPAIVTVPPAAFSGGSQLLHYASGRVTGGGGGGGGESDRHGHGGGDDQLLPPGCATDVAVGSAHFVVGTASTGVFEFPAPPLTQLDAATSCFSVSSGLRGTSVGGAGQAGGGSGGGGAAPYSSSSPSSSSSSAASSSDSHLRIRHVTDGPLWGVRPKQVAAAGHTSYVLGTNGLLYAWGLLHREWVDPAARGHEGLAWRGDSVPALVAASVAHLAAEGVLEVPGGKPGVSGGSSLDVPTDVMATTTPQVIACGGADGDRWVALAVAKTDARAGADRGADEDAFYGRGSSTNVAAELKRAQLFDTVMACRADVAGPGAVCAALGITEQHRLVPADGRVRLHRVAVPSPPSCASSPPPPSSVDGGLHRWAVPAAAVSGDAAVQGSARVAGEEAVVGGGLPPLDLAHVRSPGAWLLTDPDTFERRESDGQRVIQFFHEVFEPVDSAARPLLHELLPTFSVGAAAQCRDMVVFTGFADEQLGAPAVSSLLPGSLESTSVATSRSAWLARFTCTRVGWHLSLDVGAMQWLPEEMQQTTLPATRRSPTGLPPSWSMAPRMLSLHARIASDAALAMRGLHERHLSALFGLEASSSISSNSNSSEISTSDGGGGSDVVRASAAGSGGPPMHSAYAAALHPLAPLDYDQETLIRSVDSCPRALLADLSWLDAPLEALEPTAQPVAAAESLEHAGVVLFRGALLEAANRELAVAAAAAAAAARLRRQEEEAELAAAAAAATEVAAASVAATARAAVTAASVVPPSAAADEDEGEDAGAAPPPENPALEALFSSLSSPGQRLKAIRRRAVPTPTGTPRRKGGGKPGAATPSLGTASDAAGGAPLALAGASLLCCYHHASDAMAVVVTLEEAPEGGGDADSSETPGGGAGAGTGRLGVGGTLAPVADTVDTVALHTRAPAPLAWFEVEPCFEHVCRHAYGRAWRRELQAALCSVARARYAARVRRYEESGELSRAKRSRARAQALEDAHAAGLCLAHSRRARMGALLARLACDFALSPVVSPAPPPADEAGGGIPAPLPPHPGSVSPLARLLPRYSAHNAVLAARVPHFYGRMLQSGMREATARCAGLPPELGGSPAAIVAFLRYVYTGKLVIPAGGDAGTGGGGGSAGGGGGHHHHPQLATACALLAAADVCLLGDLKAACEQWLLARFASPHADAASLRSLADFAAHTHATRLHRHVTVVGQACGAIPVPTAPARSGGGSSRAAVAAGGGGAMPLPRLAPAPAATAWGGGSPLSSARRAGRGGTEGEASGLPPLASSSARPASALSSPSSSSSSSSSCHLHGLALAVGGIPASASSVSLALAGGGDSAPTTARSDLTSLAGDDARSAFTGV